MDIKTKHFFVIILLLTISAVFVCIFRTMVMEDFLVIVPEETLE